MYQKELFANYELDDSRWKRVLLTLLGASLALHLFVLVVTLFVPSVRDALYIASIFANSDSRVTIDQDYVLEEIKNATVIDLSSERLEYPAGYFALANGDAPAPDFAALTNTPQPEIISQNNGFPNDPAFPPLDFGAQPLPTPFPTPTPYSFPNATAALPSPILPSRSTSNNLPALRKGKKRPLPEVPVNEPNDATAAQNQPTPDKNQTAKAEASPKPSPAASPSPAAKSSDVKMSPAGFEINERPLKDLGKKMKERVLVKKDIDLSADVEVNLSGEFDKSGKLKNIVNRGSSGDPELIKASQDLLLALNASGYLQYLQELYKDGGKGIMLSIKQNKQQDKVLFVIQADEQTPETAVRRRNTLSSLIGLAKLTVKDDEATLLNQTFVETNDKQVIIKLDMSRAVAQEIINRKINEVKPEPAQPNQASVNTPPGK